jgi:ATP-dependent Clp protease ATP-binding subunit ClpA
MCLFAEMLLNEQLVVRQYSGGEMNVLQMHVLCINLASSDIVLISGVLSDFLFGRATLSVSLSLNQAYFSVQGKLDPVVGRIAQIERVTQILGRRTKNNPCLIGEPGVGKTAVAEGLAQRIVSGDVPETIEGKKVITLDMGLLVAGTKYRGEFEERLKKLMEEIKQADDIILVIDEVHTLIGAGAAEGAIDAANILKPALARGELQVRFC